MSTIWDWFSNHKYALIAIVTGFILAFPVSLTSSAQNVPYQVTQSSVVTTTTTVAIQKTMTSIWNVTWYSHTNGNWGALLGTQQFPATFAYDWQQSPSFGNYQTNVGFVAVTEINVSRSGPVAFAIGSDDGSKLYLDGNLIIDNPDLAPSLTNWFPPAYHEVQKTVNPISRGIHILKMEYWQDAGFAKVSFSTDSDVTSWKTTVYTTQSIPTEQQNVVTQYKQVTTFVYHSVLEYIMRFLGIWPLDIVVSGEGVIR